MNCKLAILRSSSMEVGKLYFEKVFKKNGYDLTIDYGGYDQYYQEILNHNSFIYRKRYDAIVLFIDINFSRDEFKKFLNSIFVIRKNTNTPIIISNKIVPVDTFLGIYDSNYMEGYKSVIQERNSELNKFISFSFFPKIVPNCYIFDLNSVASRVGHENFFDKRMKYVARSLYTPIGYSAIARELLKFITVLKGKKRKCIVVDCDNTLWGGVIGEDGINGIKLGTEYPGNCYVDFQKTLLGFSQKGFILAINSKNNKEDVLEVLKNHPHQILKEEHFTIIKTNWENKVNNMQEIAKTLNIGLDSFVFIDDNPVEIDLVKTKLPEVLTVDISNIYPEFLPDLLYSINELETLSYTQEDKEKLQQYRDQIKRESEKSEYSSIDDYLRSLSMKMTIYANPEFQIERLSQLTQKTNQFNLTTRRYSESEMLSYITTPDKFVYSFELEDKFGNNGITGLCMINATEGEAVIDVFLMSCRVIERTAEFSFMQEILSDLKHKGIYNIIGLYYKTNKNSLVSDFYDKLDFSLELEKDNEKIYHLDLRNYKEKSNPLIEVIWNTRLAK